MSARDTLYRFGVAVGWITDPDPDSGELADSWGESQTILAAAAVVCFGMLALSVAGPGTFSARDAAKLVQLAQPCTEVFVDAVRLSCFDAAFSSIHPAKGATAPVLTHGRP